MFVSLTDPRVLAIEFRECGEDLIDVAPLKTVRFGPSPEIENNTDYTKIRRGVYEKLLQANNLLPDGMQLCLYEGWRSLSLQEKLFREQMTRIAASNPEFSEAQLFQEASKMVSPITNADGTKNIPPHNTGGAVDIYLVDDEGKIVDMGLEIKDWTHDITGKISETDSVLIDISAKKNRQLMSKALMGSGFVNYPGEYWHWSYGDRYWAFAKKQEFAIYGPIS